MITFSLFDAPVQLWTDGSCLKNPDGPGGWGVVMQRGDSRTCLSGHDPSTTNNRMEMTAVLRALEQLEVGERAEVLSDSQLLIKGCSEWLQGWKRREWVKSDGKPVLNQDLWKLIDAQILRLGRAKLTFTWVRGHVGTELNELADKLAGDAARTPGR